MVPHDAAPPDLTPQTFVERIVREHEQRRRASSSSWNWEDDPEGAKLVALAAMATRWNVDAREFEQKLLRLARLPTGVAAPAARRMLAMWWEACAQSAANHRE